jgi:predicted AlkP superfamily pyrophosphatase or phosphodiesterase
MPDSPALPQAEPIWATAHRQGVRTLVYDWPMSYRRADQPARSDVAFEKFDPKPTDAERLTRLLDAWTGDSGHDKPLRLLMGYIKAPDGAGHKYGPDAPQLNDVVHDTDANLQTFVDGVTAQFNKQRVGDEQLYVVLSTDHGMAAVKTVVNVRKLFATPPPATVRIITAGPLAMVYFDQVPPHDRDALTKSMLAELKKHEFLSAYTHETLPKSWRMDHPSRVGEITIMLEPGHSFSTKHDEPTYAVQAGDEPQGMHGYPPDKSPEMRGLMVIWRYPAPLAGRNLGTVHGEQLHPTVARLLGIHPSEDAKAAAVLER